MTLIGAEPLLPHRRPPLTREFLRGELDARELPIEQREWFAEQDVRLCLRRRVRKIDPRQGTLKLGGDAESGVPADELRVEPIAGAPVA